MKTLLPLLFLSLFWKVTPFEEKHEEENFPMVSTLTVTNTANSGTGSLRWALENATANDIICFNISGTPPHIIQPTTFELPPITVSGVQIDATQNGYSLGDIQLDGSQLLPLNEALNGLVIENTSNVTIKGLFIYNFPDDGISVENSSNVTIDGNVCSGNGAFTNEGEGIYIFNGSSNITVTNNYLGTDLTGNSALPNTSDGLDITGSSTATISGNVISGNGRSGMLLFNANGIIFTNNIFGLNVNATSTIPNGEQGIETKNSDFNTSGGGNVIAGNTFNGIYISDNTSAGSSTVTGNFIGLNSSGSSFGHSGYGILVTNSNTSVTIQNNEIAFNNQGAIEVQSNASSVQISQNEIHCNTNTGIEIWAGGNGGITPPVITLASTSSIEGTSTPSATIEVFLVDNSVCGNAQCQGQGRTYLGTVTADGSGNWILNNPSINVGDDVTATQTSGGNTSEFALCSSVISMCPTSNGGTTITVTNTNDSGLGSLRQAILCANADPVLDNIEFNIPGSGPYVIQPLTNLPTISDSGVTLDGTTEPNWDYGTIQIDGNQVSGTYALRVSSSNCNIYGIEFYKNGSSGLLIQNSSNCIIGDLNKGNVFNNSGRGIEIVQSNSIFIRHNRIGTNAAGNAIVGNVNGIRFNANSNNITIENNLISGNGTGIANHSNGYTASTIQNNFIGTGLDGSTDLGNTSYGIRMNDICNCTNNTISNNYIGFNGLGGIRIDNSNTGNLISENIIFCNNVYGIGLISGGNNNIQSPSITSATTSQVSGTAPNNTTIEVFTNVNSNCGGSPCQGKFHLGTTTANSSGNWSLTSFNLSVSTGDQVTATATDAANNTSEFSLCATVCAPITATDPNIETCTDEAMSYDLTQHDNTVNGGSGNTVTWYDGDPNNGGTIISNPNNVNLNNINDLWAEVSDGTCTNTVDVTVTINPQITVEVTGPMQVNVGSSINLNGTVLQGGSGNFTYTWVLIPISGDATLNPTNTQNTTLTGVAAGDVMVEFFVQDDNGCSAFANYDVEVINPCSLFDADLLGTTTICNGNPATLTFQITAGTPPYNVTWANGNLNGINNGWTESVFPNSTTTYEIFSITDANGCPGLIGQSATVTVEDVPQSPTFISGNNNVCLNDLEPYSITTISGANTYSWLVTNGTIQSGQGTTNIQVLWNGVGGGDVCVTANNDCGPSPQTCLSVNINQVPNISTSDTPEICNGETFDLSTVNVIENNGTTGTITYHSSSPANTGNQISSFVSPSSTTTYFILWTTPSGCSDETSVEVEVNNTPTAMLFANESSGNANNDNIICEGDVVNFSASGGVQYEFFIDGQSQGPPSSSNGFSSSTLSDGDEITVIVTDGNGCTDETLFGDGFNMEPITITVNETPNLTGLSLSTSNPNNEFCESEPILINLNVNAPLQGNFTIDYNLSGANNVFNQKVNVVINGGFGIINLGALPQVGNTTFTINSVTNSEGCVSIPTSGNTLNFTIIEEIDLSTLNVMVSSICVGEDAEVVIQNGPQSGFYDINYSVIGANNISSGNITLPFAGGNADFIIVSSLIPNAGVSTFTIDDMQLFGGGCPSIGASDNVDFEVNEAPTVTNIQENCAIDNQTYTVTFDILGGDSNSYMVNGNSVTSPFTSAPIPNGDPYSFDVDDANQCGPVNISGLVDCGCATDAGTMNATLIEVCEDELASAIFNNDQNLDADDVLNFALHDNSGLSLGSTNIIGLTSEFGFDSNAGFVLGQTYYISSIAGNDDGSGFVDLNDPCLSVSQGTPVIFYAYPNVDLGANQVVCPNDFVILDAGNPGTTYNWNTGESTQTIIVEDAGTYTVTVTNAVCSDTDAVTISTSDTEDPILTCPEDVSVTVSAGSMGTNISNLAPEVSDNCGIDLVTFTLSGATTGSGNDDASGEFFNIGFTELMYEVTDVGGNTAFCFSVIEVVEGIIPCRQIDSVLLVSLFDLLDGANWIYTATTYWDGNANLNIPNAGNAWGFNQPINTWHGVELNNEGCLNKLILNEVGASGSIPVEIGDFTAIEEFYFYENDLTGTIPPEIGNMTGVTVLSFANNQLEGAIPPEIGNLTELVRLDLSNNDLKGEIPNTLLNLQNLRDFEIQDNQFTFTHLLHNLDSLESIVNSNANTPIFDFYDYAPQDSIFQKTNVVLQAGETFFVDLLIDDTVTTSSYQWYKDGVELNPVLDSNKFEIQNVDASHEGNYWVHVTNPNADSLTLESRCIALTIIIDQCFIDNCADNITVSCQDDINDLSTTGETTSNCPNANIIFEDDTSLLDPCGNGFLFRKFVLIDNGIRLDSCTQQIKIEDQTPLIVSFPFPYFEVIDDCPNPSDYDPEDLPAMFAYPTYINDDCEELEVSHTDVSDVQNCTLSIQRVWSVTNLCSGQVTQAQQNLVIQGNDNVPPDFPNGCTIPTVCINSNICDTTIILPTPEVMDCDENVQISVTSDLGNDFGPHSNIEPGIYSVEYTATDVCGNQNTCSTQIEIQDCFAPIADCADLTIDLQDNNPPSVQISADQLNNGSSDNCVGALQFSFSMDVIDILLELDCSNVGTQNIQMWVTDESGNQSFCTSNIQITDSGDLCQPIGCQLVCQGQIQVSAGGNITFDMVLESDLSLCPNADFVLEIQDQNGQTLDGPSAELPTDCDYIGQDLTIVLTDNNSGENCSSILVVEDNVEPDLSCPNDITVTIPVGGNNAVVNDIDAIFSDNCTANLSYTSINATILSGTGQVSGQLFNVGTTEVTYMVADGFNEVTCMFNVTVENETSACLQSDSLSLVDFYNALTECNNWIIDWDLNEPFKNWEGVFTNQFGCVTGIFLPNNNLCGELPLLDLPNLIFINLDGNQIYGTIPDWELPNLVEFSLANNQLDSMTQMVNFINSAQPFTEIHLENNAFTFDDILPNFGSNISGINFIGPPFDLTYHPQDSVFENITVTRFIGQDFFIDLGIDAGVTSNIYEWFKDGVSWNTFDNNKLEIQGVTLADAGEYKAQITNPFADQLTLYTKCIRLEVLDPCEGFEPSLGNDFSICQGDTTILNAGIAQGYLWSTGDTTQTIEVTQSGTYSVIVTNEFGCDRGDEITIGENPIYDETQEPIICEGDSFQVGDSIYTQAGMYTNLLQSEFGCDSSVTTILTVIDLAIDLGDDAVICVGDCVDLDATIPNCPDCEYSWSDDPVETSPARSVCPNSDISIVVNVINAQDCEVSDTIFIQVNYPPDAPDFTGEFSVCENATGQYDISNFDPDLNYYWTLPAGASFTNNGDHILVDFSTFNGGNICLESEDSCGLSTQTCKSLEIKELPEMPTMDTGKYFVCQNEIVEYCLNPTANTIQYTWVFPTGTITNDEVCQTYEWQNTGAQIFSIIAQNECGDSEASNFTVNVFERPFGEFIDENLSVCAGEMTDLIIELSGQGPWKVTYFDGVQNQIITGITQSPHYESVSPTQTTTYSLVEVSNEYCVEPLSGTLTIFVDDSEEAFLSENICEGETFEFDGQILTETGTYSADFQNINGCDSTVILDLIVNDFLELTPETDFFFFPEEENSTLFEVTENDDLPSDGWELILPETETDLGSLSIGNGAIRYDLIQEDFSGIDSFYYEICQISCPENCYPVLVEVSFQISCVKEALQNLPTAFSPFQVDGINDEFDPLQTFTEAGCPVDPRETTFVVANRWGEVVFKPTRYPESGWQGQKQDGGSKKLPQGTYYYYLSFPLDGKKIEVQKPIELLY